MYRIKDNVLILLRLGTENRTEMAYLGPNGIRKENAYNIY